MESMSFVPVRCGRAEPPWTRAGAEPSLAEILADPIVHLVMRRDGVAEIELRLVIAAAQARIGSRLCPCRAA
jgi:hypothetical protein